MFSSSLRASLVAFVAYAIAVSAAPTVPAAPGLTVKTSTSEVDVDGLKNLQVVVTVVNTGGETLKLLNDPRGVLDSFPTDSFTITDTAGSSPSFNGVSVKYSPSQVAGFNDPTAFTVLAPGDSIDVIHELSSAYDFTRSGAGAYSIEPSSLFTYVGLDGTTKDLYATVEGIAKVKLSGDLAGSPAHSKRANFNSCSDDQQTQITAAITNAQKYASDTYSYIEGISTGTDRYKTWFGTYHGGRKATVQSHFEKISGNDFSEFTYDCSCTKSNVYAYVYASQFGTIYLCPAFWRASATGTDSQAGTIVHEASHFTVNGGTKDYAYGQANCKSLASSDPDKAAANADNHEYFTENTPALD